MLRRIRSQLTYANVMATIAVFVALGGGAYAATAAQKNSVSSRSIRNGQVKRPDLGRRAVGNSKLANGAVSSSKIRAGAVGTSKIADGAVTNGKLAPDAVTTGNIAANGVTTPDIADNAVTTTKLADNAVTTTKLSDNAVTTTKLADNAVTSPKLAANSVSGLIQIADGTVTGSDVLENTLTFGCSVIALPGGTAGPFQIANGGFCAIVLHPSTSRTWTQAATDCTGTVPDSTLATPAQIAELQASAGGNQGPVAGTTGIWTPDPSASASAWTVTVDNGGLVSAFASTAISTASSGPIVCVYEPASKNG